MKLTKSKLKRIIKEEISKLHREGFLNDRSAPEAHNDVEEYIRVLSNYITHAADGRLRPEKKEKMRGLIDMGAEWQRDLAALPEDHKDRIDFEKKLDRVLQAAKRELGL